MNRMLRVNSCSAKRELTADVYFLEPFSLMVKVFVVGRQRRLLSRLAEGAARPAWRSPKLNSAARPWDDWNMLVWSWPTPGTNELVCTGLRDDARS